MNGESNPQADDLSDTVATAALFGNKEMLETLLRSGFDPNIPNSKGNYPLHEAAHHGEIECASLLLDHRASVNAVGFEGKTPLHMAVDGVCVQTPEVSSDVTEFVIQKTQMNLVQLLVAHGADFNAKDDSGCTPRDLAMHSDFYDCADLIDEMVTLQFKQTADALYSKRLQDLFASCKEGNLNMVMELLPNVKEALNQFYCNNKQNLLMCAAEHGHLAIVDYCLSLGAVAIANPHTNKTALHLACENGHTDVVVTLLNQLPALLMIDDSPGETSLHIASRKGHVDIVRNLLRVAEQTAVLKSPDCPRREEWDLLRAEPAYLYDKDNHKHTMNESLPEIEIDVLARSSSDQRTPLHDAAITGNAEIVQLLVDFMRNSSLSPRQCRSLASSSSNSLGRGTFHSSKYNTSPQQSNLDGPSFGKHNNSQSPNSSSKGRHSEPVSGIDLMTLKGRTAFHEASRQHHFKVMEILLLAGADINAFMNIDLDRTVNTDLTALVQACLMNKLETVRFLLHHGAKDARLKALSRSLKGSLYEVAGILLCNNNYMRELMQDVRNALGLSTDVTKIFLQVMWNSKNLAFICKQWLDLVVTEFPRASNHLCAIAQLDISSNQITELPIEIFKLPSLVNLDVSRNQIGVLPYDEDKPHGGWKCCRLATLECIKNNLCSLPPCLFRLNELKEINACSNKISAISPSVWMAPKLKRLYLAGNCLDTFPSPKLMLLEMDEPIWNVSGSPPQMNSLSPTSPVNSAISDSGYRSDVHSNLLHQIDTMSLEMARGPSQDGRGGEGNSDDEVFPPSRFKIPCGPTNALSKLRMVDHSKTHAIQTQAVISRRMESFHDTIAEAEELEDLDEGNLDREDNDVFPLEVLDLSANKLTVIIPYLSCLTPKLTKLNISKNQIKYLGNINDFPVDIEFLDASNNLLHTAIAPSLGLADRRNSVPICARKLLSSSPGFVSELPSQSLDSSLSGSPSYHHKLCSHRMHKNLRKLSTLKLNHNKLMDLQLFRSVSRNVRGTAELGASFEETSKPRSHTSSDPFAVVINTPPAPTAAGSKLEVLSKSVGNVLYSRASALTVSRKVSIQGGGGNITSTIGGATHHDTGKGSGSAHSDGSHDGHDSKGEGSGSSSVVSVVKSLLYPTLATLELSHNCLRNVPSNVHHIGTLSCLLLSHNHDIDTLPLELSNLEHLWNLEYDGCPLTNPPKEDLDKFRLASDKLLYMRSLLHDAKPNESMKLMLVGYQKMGKTTLLSRLREVHEKVTPFTTFTQRISGEEPVKPKRGRIETLSTVGVDLGIWKYRKDLEGDYLRIKKKGNRTLRCVTFYTWDFGGQEEYYVTHQCFLSTRSLYLVVWSVMDGEQGIENLGLWLHNIQARAPGSPVVIVGTHCDSLKPDMEKEKRKADLNHSIYQKYLVGHGSQQLRERGLPKILDVTYVGCPLSGRPEGVAELRAALYDIAFSLSAHEKAGNTKTKLLEQPIPASFLRLEEVVRHIAANCKQKNIPPVLKEQDFREKTMDTIANPRELNQAVTFLHENGIMLHYATPALSHLYFVDPQWLCDMLAHIVTVPEVNRFIPRQDSPEAGILRTTVLSHVFKGDMFPQAHRKEYIELLGKFEVALYLDRHRLLVPSMLPQKPAFTVHHFNNVFPRPPLYSILLRAPETQKLFSGHKSSMPLTPSSSSISSSSSRSSCRHHSPIKSIAENTPISPTTPIMRTSEEFFRTGLILRRFYFMSYVPSGFWARLISRFLASSEFVAIVIRNLGCERSQVKEMMGQMVSIDSKATGLDLEWGYWKTGIELWYKGLSLLRLCEIHPEGSFHGCKSSPSIFAHSVSSPIEPSVDVRDLTFELNGKWIPVDMNPNRGIEILVPDAVCLSMLHNCLQDVQNSTSSCLNNNPPQSPNIVLDEESLCPEYESHWMSAELLSYSVDFIDTLLEDWYPGLGCREGGKTMDYIPYVNRVIPCPFCISSAIPLEEDMAARAKENGGSPHSPSTKKSFKIPQRKPRSSHSSSSSPPLFSSPAFSSMSKAKRSLFPKADSQCSNSDAIEPQEGVILESSEERTTRRQGSLLELHGKLGVPVVIEPKKLEPAMTVVSKFGFMIESCIVAARNSQPMICPAHPDHELPIKDIAPDLVFADLPASYLLNPACVDKGEYIDHGSFGDIYHGTVYPSVTSTDDEGREVAIKIDRLDAKKFTAEIATKSYVEVRAEVSILSRLQHPHVIDFIGVVLRPLCFILEWAHGGSLHSVLQKYRKMDGWVSPRALQRTAYQVASGLAYLHEHKIVYYDLKSPNVLVFQFPSVHESLLATQSQGFTGQFSSPSTKNAASPASNVLIKIADLGISQVLSPGGVMGFKGSPGFMAPEILKYVGTEACSEKVDIYSYAMFLYETISLNYPFEKQNLMHAQIEKLVIDGERPPLQNRELNSPMLYLDVMRWCWQQDFRNRPSASQLMDVLTNPSIPYLVDAIPLHNSDIITCVCICTLPFELMSPNDPEVSSEGVSSVYAPPTATHAHVTQGDLQEELWLARYNGKEKTSDVVVINFKGKAVQSFPVCNSKITAMCGVNCSMWLGTEHGEIIILDVFSKHPLFRRYLAVHSEQSIMGLYHLLSFGRVVVARKDGYLIICKEDTENRNLADTSTFDNRQNSTALPVRYVSRFPEPLPVLCSTAVSVTLSGHTKWSIWCGTYNEMIISLDVTDNLTNHSQKLYNRPRYEVNYNDHVASIVTTETRGGPGVSTSNVWAFTRPSGILYCWDPVKEVVLNRIDMRQYSPDPISLFSVMDTRLLFAVETGKVFQLTTKDSKIISSIELRGHAKEVYGMLSLGARTLPRHWLPSIMGRDNVINYYKDLVDEKEVKHILATMVGRQTRLLVSVGRGYQGVAGRLIEPLMSPRDSEETFVLLWSLDM